MSFAQLDELNRKLDSLSHALVHAGVDEAVMMPEGGGEKRAEAIAALSGMYHDMAAAPHIADWIAKTESESLDDSQRIAVKEFRRSYINRTCLSSVFVQKQAEQRLRCEQLWRQLRPTGDWKGFLPAFSAVVDTMREEAAMRAEALKLSPYDALAEQYDPGARVADIEPVFADLKAFLKDFIPVAVEKQKSKTLKPLSATYPIRSAKGTRP